MCKWSCSSDIFFAALALKPLQKSNLKAREEYNPLPYTYVSPPPKKQPCLHSFLLCGRKNSSRGYVTPGATMSIDIILSNTTYWVLQVLQNGERANGVQKPLYMSLYCSVVLVLCCFIDPEKVYPLTFPLVTTLVLHLPLLYLYILESLFNLSCRLLVSR